MSKSCFLKETIILTMLVSFTNHAFSADETEQKINDLTEAKKTLESTITFLEKAKEPLRSQVLAAPLQTTCKYTQELKLVTFDENALRGLSFFTNLTSLTLLNPSTPHPGFSTLSNLPLTFLDISGHTLKAQARFDQLSKIQTLESLTMRGCEIKIRAKKEEGKKKDYVHTEEDIDFSKKKFVDCLIALKKLTTLEITDAKAWSQSIKKGELEDGLKDKGRKIPNIIKLPKSSSSSKVG